MSAFDTAVALILRLEGKETNDPADPGGRTKFGLSQRAYPALDMDTLTKAAAVEIYRTDYWTPLRCGEMPPAIGLAVFDCAVNQGQAYAARAVQRACGATADGVIGPRTLAATFRAPQTVLVDFMTRRAMHYADLGHFRIFGRGWIARLFIVHREAVELDRTNV